MKKMTFAPLVEKYFEPLSEKVSLSAAMWNLLKQLPL